MTYTGLLICKRIKDDPHLVGFHHVFKVTLWHFSLSLCGGSSTFFPSGMRVVFPAVCWNAFTATSEGGNLKSLLTVPKLNLIHISGTNMSWISIGWSCRSCNSNAITETCTYSLVMELIKLYSQNGNTDSTQSRYITLKEIRYTSLHLSDNCFFPFQIYPEQLLKYDILLQIKSPTWSHQMTGSFLSNFLCYCYVF